MTDEKRSEDETTETEEDEGAEEDAANPAAIARRVAALGADDETEAFARGEERKLAERRAGKKKGKKKAGLEVAASKKLAKIGSRAEPKRSVAVASDADPLIERTAKLSDWAKKNQKTVQLVGLGLVVVGLLPQAGSLLEALKLLLVWLTVLLAGATVGQLIARVARQAGTRR